MRVTISKTLFIGLLLQAVAMAQEPAWPVTLSLPSQPLRDALNSFARETNLQVVYSAEEVPAALMSPKLEGNYTTEGALRALLKNTDLSFQFLNPRTVAVTAAKGAASTARAQAHLSQGGSDDAYAVGGQSEDSQHKSFWERFRLAQVDQGQTTGTGPVESQQKSGPGTSLSEVVVTAQRRTERLLDVPISMVALGTDELQNRKITSLTDLQFAVPGMGITTDGVTNTIELRGVSNILGSAALVGIYLDEADVTNGGSAQINANTYDLERVEVLRGPQGTLYGEGSVGGTIRFITKNPALDKFGMTASVESTFTQDGSPGERINTAVNVPLIDQELGIRFVGTYDREGGWIDQPAAGLKDINGQDLTNVRLKGLWKPSPEFSATLMAELYRNDRSTGNFEDTNGNFTQVFSLTTAPKVSEDHDIYNLTLTYDFPAIKLLSATSYLREKTEAKNVGYVYPLNPEPPAYDAYYPYDATNDHAWVEELRLSSIGSGPLQWTVGGFYRRYRDVSSQPVVYGGFAGPLPPPFQGQLADTLFKSWSVFGDINYSLWERLTLGLGVRSFHEDQEFLQTYDLGGGPTTIGQHEKFHSADPRVYVRYKINRDINIYASAAKGFRSGGFNADPTQPTFGPEDVRTYELGTKMSTLEGRLRAETAIFYTDYKDYVVAGYLPGQVIAVLANAGDARIRGVEWDFVWRPWDQWSLGINGDYLDTQFTRINASSTAYAVGDPLALVPKYQLTSSLERDFAWSDKKVSMRLDYTRRGRMTFRDRSVGPWYYGESDVNNLLGSYMNLHWNQSLSFNLFAQNLLNDRGLITPSIGTPVRSRPRTYGVGFDVSL